MDEIGSTHDKEVLEWHDAIIAAMKSAGIYCIIQAFCHWYSYYVLITEEILREIPYVCYQIIGWP